MSDPAIVRECYWAQIHHFIVHRCFSVGRRDCEKQKLMSNEQASSKTRVKFYVGISYMTYEADSDP